MAKQPQRVGVTRVRKSRPADVIETKAPVRVDRRAARRLASHGPGGNVVAVLLLLGVVSTVGGLGAWAYQDLRKKHDQNQQGHVDQPVKEPTKGEDGEDGGAESETGDESVADSGEMGAGGTGE